MIQIILLALALIINHCSIKVGTVFKAVEEGLVMYIRDSQG